MAGTRELQLRMKSVQGTQQITRAMKLVSTAKLQKVRAVAEANQAYFESIRNTVRSIITSSGPGCSPAISEQFTRRKGRLSSDYLRPGIGRRL